jgi:hypothetical protein
VEKDFFRSLLRPSKNRHRGLSIPLFPIRRVYVGGVQPEASEPEPSPKPDQ